MRIQARGDPWWNSSHHVMWRTKPHPPRPDPHHERQDYDQALARCRDKDLYSDLEGVDDAPSTMD